MSADSTAPLRVACLGGGPGGLFAAIALAHRVPGVVIDVFERNRAEDVFGFGVVFSDATLDNIDRIDPILRDTLAQQGTHWDRIEVRTRGESSSAGGNGMSAIHRRVLLGALRSRAEELGARLHFATPVDVDALAASGDYDLIVAADGANSATRERYLDRLGHQVTRAQVKFIWFGTTHRFDGLTFLHRRSEHGNFAVHAYPIGSGLSTFIVEADEDAWRAAGLDGFDTSAAPGVSDEVSKRYLEELFADDIDGAQLVANNSRWANFATRRTAHWVTTADAGVPVVLIGDAVHTAHFSVGSGTKMAMEDAAGLADALAQHPGDLDAAFADFEAARHPRVDHIQRSSVPSLSWWDHFGDYDRGLPPWQFGFHFFSRAISAAKIGKRDPAFITDAQHRWVDTHGSPVLQTPIRIGDTEFAGRLLSVRVADGTEYLTDGVREVALHTDAAQPTTGRIVVVAATEDEDTSLPSSAQAAIDEVCAERPAAVAVRGGTPLSRALTAERIRLVHNLIAIIIDCPTAIRARRAVDEADNALTVVLSGRADALAYEPPAESTTATTERADLAEARR